MANHLLHHRLWNNPSFFHKPTLSLNSTWEDKPFSYFCWFPWPTTWVKEKHIEGLRNKYEKNIEPREGRHKHQISTSTASLASMKLSSKGATECLVPNSDGHSHPDSWHLPIFLQYSLRWLQHLTQRGMLLSSVDTGKTWCHLVLLLLSLSIASITLSSKLSPPPRTSV